MTKSRIVVPISIDAWVVNDAVKRDPSKLQERQDLDFTQLKYFESPYTDVIEREEKDGIWLHWGLPKILRQGQHTKSNDNNNESIVFPSLPNRWLVTRHTESSATLSWIIESDTYSTGEGDSATVLNSNNIAIQAQIGKVIQYNDSNDLKEKTNTIKYNVDLTALVKHDPSFCHFQPYNKNVFSFFDKLDNLQEDVSKLHYSVIGWYNYSSKDSRPIPTSMSTRLNLNILEVEKKPDENDLKPNVYYLIRVNGSNTYSVFECNENLALYETSRDKDFIALGLDNSLTNEEIKCRIATYHYHARYKWKLSNILSDYVVESIYFQGVIMNVDRKYSPPQKILPAFPYPVAVGTSMFDALSAYIEFHDSDIPKELLNAFHHGLLDKLESSDANVDIRDQMHQTGFNSEHGGYTWTIVNREDKKSTVQNEVIEDLKILNESESTLEKARNILKKKQLDLYSLWWKQKSSSINNFDDNTSKEYKEIVNDIDNIVNKIIPEMDINTKITKLKNKLYKSFDLVKVPKPSFWHPRDPVLLIGGVGYQSSMKKISSDLECNELKMSSNVVGLENDIDTLLKKCTLLINSSIESKPETNDYLHQWSQPWAPHFMRWQASWLPIDFSEWKFADQVYSLENEVITNLEEYNPLLSGLSVLTPNVNFMFKRQLLKYINDNDLNFGDVKKISEEIEKWDVFAVSLSGFHSQLLQRDLRMNKIPDEPESKYFGDINSFPFHAPLAENPQSDMKFFPVRHGHFYFYKIAIIDKFGQSINVVQPNGEESMFMPILSDSLRPPSLYSSKFIQLSPRIIQDCRLIGQWVDMLSQKNYLSPNPIIAWIVPHYLDQSLQIFFPDGRALGEVYMEGQNTKFELKTTIDNSDLASIKEFFDSNSLVLLREIIESAMLKPSITDQNAQFISTLIGRPLVLAKAEWKLELREPFHTDQRYIPNQNSLDSYDFPLQIGHEHHSHDGLVGYFYKDDSSKKLEFYSHYATKDENSIKRLSSENYIKLKPIAPSLENDEINRVKETILFFDPFANVFAYTDILPRCKLTLPSDLIKSALDKLEISFRMGPLLTQRDACKTQDIVMESVRLLKPPIKENVYWNDESIESNAKEVLILPAEQDAHYRTQPNEAISGYMKFNLFSDSSKKYLSSNTNSKSTDLEEKKLRN